LDGIDAGDGERFLCGCVVLCAGDREAENVPVGVIDSTWGGTPAEAWTRMAALGEDAAVAPSFASWGRMTERQE